MADLIYLDLNAVQLYGSQSAVETNCVNALSQGIELGDTMPPVHVVKINPERYELTLKGLDFYKENLGGHHRAVAHYIANALLPCIVEKNHLFSPYCRINCRFHIRDIILYDSVDEYERRKKLSFYR
ncbi:MAG: hypothetical protein Q8R37_02010 [Nanoarchaeota archaeon]|nr:hypothetical protein [Nanoarchaeota archaeon]